MGEVLDSELLHRRIHPTHCVDGRVSSAAFKDDELSVDRAKLREADESLRGHSHCGLASVLTSDARAHHLEVTADPNLFNDSHALIKGRKSKSVQKSLARGCKWVRHVPGVAGYGAD